MANDGYYLRLMDGTTATTGYVYAGGDVTRELAGLGDFSNDGKVDILWHNMANDGYYLRLMNGTTPTTAYVYVGGNANMKAQCLGMTGLLQ